MAEWLMWLVLGCVAWSDLMLTIVLVLRWRRGEL